MSYNVFMHRFIDGDVATVPFDEVKRVVGRYGELAGDATSGWELVFASDDIAEVADIHCEDGDGVSGISLSRPTGSPAMLEFVFTVLRELKMCFFTQDCEAIWATEDVRKHVPPDLLEKAGNRVAVVTTPEELWRDVE